MAWILHGFLWSWKIDKFVTLGEKIISSTNETSKILMQHTEDTMIFYRLIIIRGHFSVPSCCGLEFCCYYLRNWLSQKTSKPVTIWAGVFRKLSWSLILAKICHFMTSSCKNTHFIHLAIQIFISMFWQHCTCTLFAWMTVAWICIFFT